MMYHRKRLNIKFKKHDIIGYTVESYQFVDGQISLWKRLLSTIDGFDKCSNCGNDELSILEFHHVFPEQKSNLIHKLIKKYLTDKTYTELLTEIDKTCCLCRNCHILYEQNQLNLKFIKNKIGYVTELL